MWNPEHDASSYDIRTLRARLLVVIVGWAPVFGPAAARRIAAAATGIRGAPLEPDAEVRRDADRGIGVLDGADRDVELGEDVRAVGDGEQRVVQQRERGRSTTDLDSWRMRLLWIFGAETFLLRLCRPHVFPEVRGGCAAMNPVHSI
jgi:hypothetical protein